MNKPLSVCTSCSLYKDPSPIIPSFSLVPQEVEDVGASVATHHDEPSLDPRAETESTQGTSAEQTPDKQEEGDEGADRDQGVSNDAGGMWEEFLVIDKYLHLLINQALVYALAAFSSKFQFFWNHLKYESTL